MRYILLLKTFLRLLVLFPLAFLSGKRVFREKLGSNYRTFKFNLLDASKVLRGLRIEREERGY